MREIIDTKDHLKVLGVTFRKTLTWNVHIGNNMKKMSKLKFLRKRLTEQLFIRATTSQFYVLFYYGSPVWLGTHTLKEMLKRMTSLHYNLLRIAKYDWKKRMK